MWRFLLNSGMRPPFCEICGEGFNPFGEDSGLLTFKPSPEDLEYLERLKQPGFTGHPPNVEWFCPTHLEMARKCTHLTLNEARKVWRKSVN